MDLLNNVIGELTYDHFKELSVNLNEMNKGYIRNITNKKNKNINNKIVELNNFIVSNPTEIVKIYEKKLELEKYKTDLETIFKSDVRKSYGVIDEIFINFNDIIPQFIESYKNTFINVSEINRETVLEWKEFIKSCKNFNVYYLYNLYMLKLAHKKHSKFSIDFKYPKIVNLKKDKSIISKKCKVASKLNENIDIGLGEKREMSHIEKSPPKKKNNVITVDKYSKDEQQTILKKMMVDGKYSCPKCNYKTASKQSIISHFFKRQSNCFKTKKDYTLKQLKFFNDSKTINGFICPKCNLFTKNDWVMENHLFNRKTSCYKKCKM